MSPFFNSPDDAYSMPSYDVNVYPGLIAGIVIGCAAVIGLTVLFCKFKSHLKQRCCGEDESDDECDDQVI